ncbi:Metallo-dependent phosphatase [Parathielavia appendiculata]|uniref:Metallo-dependent phosphatase n=1 Tax=Parathielavia appendiculata TaxID=2587402 RepID=A0AAN6Z532_9PEZI|nr:Metallo-dependent phosphatase [Parathielavia appendiculata]
MAQGVIAQMLPGGRRRPSRSLTFFLMGALTLLTLCLFTSHLPGLQRIINPSTPGSGDVQVPGEADMTSCAAAAAPHHGSDGPGGEDSPELQAPLDSMEKETEYQLQDHPMEHKTNKHPPFKDDPPQLIANLPQEHIPVYTPPSPTDGPGGGEKKTRGKRLVVVGDVHGHLAALRALLDKIGFDHRYGDHLIFAGDMITKGPDSKGVVKLAMDLGASAVRGNQDDKVLAAAREIHRHLVDDETGVGREADGETDHAAGEKDRENDEAGTEKRKKEHAHRIARSLTRAQLAWLKSLPIILRIGALPDATSPPWNANTLVVVHGGLVPGLQLERQDPWAVMNMRSLIYPGKGKGKHHTESASDEDDNDGNGEEDDAEERDDETPQSNKSTLAPDAVAVPIEGRDGEPWSHAWNRYQNRLPPSVPHTLAIYGHDAKAGLQVNPEVDISPYASWSAYSSGGVDYTINSNDITNNNNNKKKKTKKKHKQHKQHKHNEKGLRYAFGLDSGCGHGKKLTALIIEAGPAGVGHRIEQVDCRS